jgi:hypothetical protein
MHCSCREFLIRLFVISFPFIYDSLLQGWILGCLIFSCQVACPVDYKWSKLKINRLSSFSLPQVHYAGAKNSMFQIPNVYNPGVCWPQQTSTHQRTIHWMSVITDCGWTSTELIFGFSLVTNSEEIGLIYK